MRIQNNPMAINAYNNLQGTQSAQGKSLERLSSGFRINRAADDAAGLVISESLRSQVGGLKVAKRNAQDAVSLVQTAEGALTEVHSMLQRMRDLSVQSANDTNNAKGRQAIAAEIGELSTQIKNVLAGTEFNGKQIFVSHGQGAKSNPVKTDSSSGLKAAVANVTLSTGKDATYAIATDVSKKADLKDDTNGVKAPGSDDLSRSTDFAAVKSTAATAEEAIADIAEKYGIDAVNTVAKNAKPKDVQSGAKINPGDYYLEKTDDGWDLRKAKDSGTDPRGEQQGDAVQAAKLTTAQANLIEAAKAHDSETGSFKYDAAVEDKDATAPTEALNFQVGANNKGTDSLKISTDKVDLFSTVYNKLNDLNVSSNADARASIDKIDDMIGSVSSVRGTLGAAQNRLDHTINSIKVSVENLTASESRIRDTDMAEEMMNLTRAQILNQAGTAMLAQANQVPQGVLSLLR